MEKEVYYTNYVGDKEKAELLAMLKAGKAVQVGSNCIGHTRAQMVKIQAQEFFRSVGALPVEEDMWGGFYALPGVAE